MRIFGFSQLFIGLTLLCLGVWGNFASLQAQDVSCERVIPGNFNGRDEPPERTLGSNDRNYYPDLYAVDYYRPGYFYVAGGGGNPLPMFFRGTIYRGNEIIRIKVNDQGKTVQYPMSMSSDGLIQTNAFGRDAKTNIIVALDLYDRRLLKRNYPNNTKPTAQVQVTTVTPDKCEAVDEQFKSQTTADADTAYGFLISRKKNSGTDGGWSDDSYIYAFKIAEPTETESRLDGFILRAGKSKVRHNTYSKESPNKNVNTAVAADKEYNVDNTGNYSGDAMRALITIDKDKAWAVGKGVLKLFNGKTWTKFSKQSASNVTQANMQTQTMGQNGLPEEPKTKGGEENKQVCNFPDVQLNAMAGRMENRADPDTVWAVGEKGTLVRVIYTLNQVNGGTTPALPQTTTDCNACASGQNCSVDNVSKICITYKTNNNGSNNCNNTGATTTGDACEIGKNLPTEDITAISYAGGDTLYVAVKGKGVYMSSDGGKNFTQSTISEGTYSGATVKASDATLRGMSFVAPKIGYVVGDASNSNQVLSVFRYDCNCDGQNQLQQQGQNNNACNGTFFEMNNNKCFEANRKPDLNATSFLSRDIGVIVGSNGHFVVFKPLFRVACDKGGLSVNRNDFGTKYNNPPATLYDVGDPNVSSSEPIIANSQLTLCSADILRCATPKNNNNNITENCDCNQWNSLMANARRNDNSLPGFSNCDCALDIFGETNGSQAKCAEPTGTNKRKYTDVYVDAVARSESQWKLLTRPADLEIFLLDTNQIPDKSPKYLNRIVSTKDDGSRWKVTFQNPTSSNPTLGTSLASRLHRFQNLPKGQVTTTAPQTITNVQNDFIYDYAKHLKPYYCFISGGPFPECTSGQNNQNTFKFRVRALMPNFSLSPSISNLVFGVGQEFAEKRRVRIVRPALVPYMYAPRASKVAYCNENGGTRQDAGFQNGYQGALDSFMMPTNTAYKLDVKVNESVANGIYDLMIDKIKGKVEDTPLMRRHNNYDTLKPDHDQTWINLELKHNYINSFKPSPDIVHATINGPVYDPYMRRNEAGQNGTRIPSRPTTLMPTIVVNGLRIPEAHDIDAQGNFIGDSVKKIVIKPVDPPARQTNPPTTILVTDKTKPLNLRLHLSNEKLKVLPEIPNGNPNMHEEQGKNDVLNFVSNLRDEQLPTKRFPKIKRVRTCISRTPLDYTFGFKDKNATGRDIRDGDWVNNRNGRQWVWSKQYNNRTELLDVMRFTAEGKPIGDTIFTVKLDSRYGYRIGAIYDKRKQFDKEQQDKRHHYYLLKKDGKQATDSMALRGHTPCAAAGAVSPPASGSQTSVPFFIDSIRIWDYDTARKANTQNVATGGNQNTTICPKVYLDMEEHKILVRQNFTNYTKHNRVDTITYFVDGYEGRGPSPSAVITRKIRFLRVIQEAAFLHLGKDSKGKPAADKVNVSLSYARDSVKNHVKTDVIRGQRDSIFVRANVKWYIKTKRRNGTNTGGSTNGNSDAYGKGFGVWWDTLDYADIEWKTLKDAKPDIPKNWPNGQNPPNGDDMRVGLANDREKDSDNEKKPPFFKILFKAVKSNISKEQMKDSIEVCTLGDSVCSIVYITQDTPKLNVQLLTNNYRDSRTKKKPYNMFNGFKQDKSPYNRTRDSLRVQLPGLGEWRLVDSGCYEDKKAYKENMEYNEEKSKFKPADQLPQVGTTDPKKYIPIWLEEQRKQPDFSDDTVTIINPKANLSDSQRHCIFKICAISWECALNKKDSLNSERKYCQDIHIVQDTATITVKLSKQQDNRDPKTGKLIGKQDGLPPTNFEDGDAAGKPLTVPYFLGAKSSVCLGSDGDIEVEMPSFLKMIPCGNVNNDKDKKAICNADSNGTKQSQSPPQPAADPNMKPENACLFAKGDTPVYNSSDNCPTDSKWNPQNGNTNGTTNKFKHQFMGEEALDNCRPYCLQVVNRNESKQDREDKLKITVLGTKNPVTREIKVVQEGIKIGLEPKQIDLGRRAGSKADFRVSTDALWQLIDYDRTYYNFEPNSNNNQRQFDKSPFAVNLEALQSNERGDIFKTEVLVVPTDVCQLRRKELAEKLTIVQDSFWFKYTLIPTPFEYKYPEILPGPIYQVPASQNKYLQFLVESNAVWTVGGVGGIHNEHRTVLKPFSGISPYDVDTLLIRVEDLPNFLQGRDDSLDLGIIKKNGSILWKGKIHYRQKPFDFEENNLVLYPNPVTSRLYVRSVNGFKNGYVFIYNLNGELIAKRRYNDGLIDFDFGTLPVGVYIIRVYDGNIFVTKKIIRH